MILTLLSFSELFVNSVKANHGRDLYDIEFEKSEGALAFWVLATHYKHLIKGREDSVDGMTVYPSYSQEVYEKIPMIVNSFHTFEGLIVKPRPYTETYEQHKSRLVRGKKAVHIMDSFTESKLRKIADGQWPTGLLRVDSYANVKVGNEDIQNNRSGTRKIAFEELSNLIHLNGNYVQVRERSKMILVKAFDPTYASQSDIDRELNKFKDTLLQVSEWGNAYEKKCNDISVDFEQFMGTSDNNSELIYKELKQLNRKLNEFKEYHSLALKLGM